MGKFKGFGIVLRRVFGVAHCNYWVGYVSDVGHGRAIVLAPRRLTEKHIEAITARLHEMEELRGCESLCIMGLTKIKG